MYQKIIAEVVVPVKPIDFNLNLNEALMKSLSQKYEGIITKEYGVFLAVINIEDIGEGKVLVGDPSVHYPIRFEALVWIPKLQEIVEGVVVDIAEWGVFLRTGPIDGLVHISQVMDDFVSFDEKNQQLGGRSSKRILKKGDKCRARIITVSLKKENKIGLTMRQPNLGSIKWIEKENREEKNVTKPKKKK